LVAEEGGKKDQCSLTFVGHISRQNFATSIQKQDATNKMGSRFKEWAIEPLYFQSPLHYIPSHQGLATCICVLPNACDGVPAGPARGGLLPPALPLPQPSLPLFSATVVFARLLAPHDPSDCFTWLELTTIATFSAKLFRQFAHSTPQLPHGLFS